MISEQKRGIIEKIEYNQCHPASYSTLALEVTFSDGSIETLQFRQDCINLSQKFGFTIDKNFVRHNADSIKGRQGLFESRGNGSYEFLQYI